MTLDQYKAMGTTGLGDYVKQILGPQLTQGYAAEGLAGSGAAQEALAKGTAQVAEDFIKTLPAAAEQLGMLPYQQGLAASQGGLYGAQAGLAGAQAGLAGAQASHIGAMTPYEQALMGAQTGMQQAQMGLLGMQPLMQQYAMQQGALAPLQAAANFQLAQLEPWLAGRPDIAVLPVAYHRVLREPSAVVEELRAFLGLELDAEAMVRAVDPALYRQRGGGSTPGIL